MNRTLTPLLKTVVAGATIVAAAAVQAQTPAGDVKAGEAKAAMCIGCHGIPGYQNSFPEIHKVPMISGQSGPYIAAALQAYRKGDRKHPTMRGIAGSLSDQDIADLAAYYSSHQTAAAPEQPKAASAAVAALLERGACVSCHGANFSKPLDPSYPKIAGQYADYLYVSLKSYKVEGSPYIGRNNAIMGGIVQQFSNAELKQLADYLASIKGELTVKPQPGFR
ncbi:c-type cytochrome [Tepidimonas sp.]|uniref:c-type cytochrome n=1 Tax=Tepidimonas sp. TaxID=2002775 RepID=UPI0028CBE501|nr:c-type cytochrome [Tepidimonas sp.]MDT7928429.1 c-type cytochrome [Tepidimonas sp.]